MTASKETKILLDSEAEAIREKLIDAASKGVILNYSDIQLEQDSKQMTRLKSILTKVSCFERNEGRPFLCAIVVQKESNHPGDGFYELCEVLEIKKDLADLQKECFEYWGKN